MKKKLSFVETHWYMVAVEIHFIQPSKVQGADPTLRSQKLNVLITPKKRKITAKDLGDIRNLSLLRMKEQYKVDTDQIADFIVLNLMYMGMMSEHTYFTEGQEETQE